MSVSAWIEAVEAVGMLGNQPEWAEIIGGSLVVTFRRLRRCLAATRSRAGVLSAQAELRSLQPSAPVASARERLKQPALAWDSDVLENLVKRDGIRVSGAHISVIGHITAEELVALMSSRSLFNGFANRFLFVCTARVQLLPDGGSADKSAIAQIGAELAAVLEAARGRGKLMRTTAAADLWRAEYPRLSGDGYGVVGAVTSRAEAQVVRLSLTFALLDGAEAIDEPHLRAALAVWDYCAQSAQCLFGDGAWNEKLQRVLAALEAAPDGLSRTELRRVFGNGQVAGALDAVLLELLALGAAECRKVTGTGGRPREVWRSTRPRCSQTSQCARH